MTNFDIRIQAHRPCPNDLSGNWERVIQFDESSYGYFCFLYPFFDEAAKRTGQHIEREGDAVYGGTALQDLDDVISEARRSLETMPSQWQQHIFTNVHPTYEMVYTTLHKQKMEDVIVALKDAIQKAKTEGLYLVFWD